MKILFVSGNLCNGGAQRVIAVVASRLADMGHDVSLLLFARNDKEYPISSKVQVTAMAQTFDEYGTISSLNRLLFVRKYLKKTKPQVAVGFLEGGYGLYLASFGMRFKKVASSRIDPKQLWKGKGLRTKIDKRWFHAADAIVVQTSKQKVHIGEKLGKKSAVIANPISETAIAAAPAEIKDTCCRFVMAGRLALQKNYEMAFEAVRIVKETYPDVSLDVYGKGDLEAKLAQLIAEKGLAENVKMCGWTTDTVKTYRQYDAYMMTSDYEGMPNALMEAMAVGLPCISTDCDTGPEDLIRDGENGYLVPVGDAAALAERMKMLMAMPAEERKAIGAAARTTMETEFNSDKIAEKWLDLFERIVKK